MHGLDPNTDLSFLAGRQLLQLALGRFEFQLRFDLNVWISVQSKFSVTRDHAVSGYLDCMPEYAKDLHDFLGKKIESWSIASGKHLIINFEETYALCLFDTNTLQESYVIWNSEDFYAV